MDSGLDLVFEVISFHERISRQFVSEIVTARMGYTLRGLCGVFNAWLRQAPGRRPICADFLGVEGLAGLQAGPFKDTCGHVNSIKRFHSGQKENVQRELGWR